MIEDDVNLQHQQRNYEDIATELKTSSLPALISRKRFKFPDTLKFTQKTSKCRKKSHNKSCKFGRWSPLPRIVCFEPTGWFSWITQEVCLIDVESEWILKNMPSFRLEHHRLQCGELPNNPRGRVPATNPGGPGCWGCCCECADLQGITRASKLMSTADTIDHGPGNSIKGTKTPLKYH